MKELIKKLHNYVGLLSFTILVVFGATGVWAVMHESHETPMPEIARTSEVDYQVPSAASDLEAAQQIYAALKLQTARYPQEWDVKRDDQNRLQVLFWGPNGILQVTALEKKSKLKLEHRPAPLGAFMTELHMASTGNTPRSILMTVWAIYVEVSIFSMLFLIASGLFLWLTTRPTDKWAWAAFIAGTGLVSVLTVLSR